MDKEFDTNKVKYLSIPREDIIDMFMRTKFKHVVQFKELPDGYKVLGVYDNFRTRSFNVVVWHESFESNPVGAEMEELESVHLVLKEYV